MRKKLILILLIVLLLVGCKSTIYDEMEFVEKYSPMYPEIANIFDYLEAENHSINVINEIESELTFSYNVPFSYDRANEKVENYDWSIFEQYNTSLGGSLSMGDKRGINYQLWIIENDEFKLSIVYVNNNKKFLKDYDVNYLRKIGENNFVVEIIRK